MTSKVLIVDDVAINLLMLKAVVSRLPNVEAVCFASAVEALAWAARETPDLVLLDYMMPEMTGEVFLHRLRAIAHCASVPVIVITSRTDRPILLAALDAGANDFLRKPIDDVELMARARNMLELGATTRRLYALATTDDLTGQLNRRSFMKGLFEETERARRYGQECAVLMFDIDHFKRVNDSRGHAAGDAVLRAVATACAAELRSPDVLGRLGGEEFGVLLGNTGRDGAALVAERLRAAVAALAVRSDTGPSPIRVTISVGAAVYRPEETTDQLLARADAAVYAAKAAGRNDTRIAA